MCLGLGSNSKNIYGNYNYFQNGFKTDNIRWIRTSSQPLIILSKLLMSKGLLAAEGKDSAVQTPDNKHFTGIYP